MSNEKLDEIVNAYNAEGDYCYEYNTENEDCPLAEFVASFGYGEQPLTMEKLLGEVLDAPSDDDVISQIETLLKAGVSEQDILAKAVEACSLTTGDMYSEYNEAYSIGTTGEQEWQPSDELLAQYEALSAEDKAYVRKNCEWYISDSVCVGWLYVNCDYHRWILKLDVEAFSEALSA